MKYTVPANLPLSISPHGELLVRKSTGLYVKLSECEFTDKTLCFADMLPSPKVEAEECADVLLKEPEPKQEKPKVKPKKTKDE